MASPPAGLNMRIGYLGPEGTFTHQAAQLLSRRLRSGDAASRNHEAHPTYEQNPDPSSCAQRSGDAGSLPSPSNFALDQASAAVSGLAAAHGAWGVRVHDVAATKAALNDPAGLDPEILDAVASAWKPPLTP